uniref:Ribosomal protein L6 n=1 Tax=Cyanophora sudae TaxID=1522369 RepID=A0A873WVC3_9EUKA|nr:ribosomal protein L6 [Cyanophora sudae]QPB15059.1 ribosomal protein L6 [Cyanophora sudae]
MTKFANFQIKNNLLDAYYINKEKKIIIIKCKTNDHNKKINFLGNYTFLHFYQNATSKLKFIAKDLYKNKCINLIKNFTVNGQQFFRTSLKLNGLGFRVFKFFIKQRNKFFLKFKLGFSHKIYVPVPEELIISCRKKNKIILASFNKQKLTNFAKKIQLLKFPEIYSNKGIILANQQLRIKPGKKKN